MTRARLALGGAAVVSLFATTQLSTSQLDVYVLVCLATLVGCGLTLLVGFAGQVSLGQAAFLAIGAYTAALLARDLGAPTWLALAMAPVSSGLVATLLGWPLLRLRGHSLAFGTLALQLIALSIASQARDFTGGDVGMSGIPPLGVGPFILDGPWKSLLYTWGCTLLAVLVVVATMNLTASRPGRALRALATSEQAAAASGVSIRSVKLQVFALSAALAGLAGGVFAFYFGYIAPGSFPLLLSIEFLIMVSVGGLGSPRGAPLGAVLILVVLQVLQTVGTLPGMPHAAPVIFSYALYAVALIVIFRFRPRGLLRPSHTD